MLNQRIKELRAAHSMNQVELARELSVSKQTVSNWENDNIQPSIEMLLKIAHFFNVSTDYLLGNEPLKTINADGLSDNEIAHINFIINDYKKLHKKFDGKV